MKAADVRSVFWALCLTSLVTMSAFAEEPESDEPAAPPPKYEMIPVGGSSGPAPSVAPTGSSTASSDDANEEKSVLMKVVTKGGKIVRTEIVPDATPTAETPIESIPGPTEIEFQAASPKPTPSPRPRGTTPLPHSPPTTSRSSVPTTEPSTHPSAVPAKLPSPSPSPKPAGPDAELLRLLRR